MKRILFEAKRCIHSRFCVTGAPKVFLANVKGPSIECQGITVPWFTAPPQGGQG